MRKSISSRFLALIVFLAFCFLGSFAWAGIYEDGVYTSNLGYTIEPPTNWVRVDAATYNAVSQDLPKLLRSIDVDKMDVVFYKPLDEADKRSDKFVDSITITPLKAKPSVKSEEAAQAIAAATIKNFENDPTTYKSPKLVSVEFTESSKNSAFTFVWNYESMSKSNVYIEQRVFLLSKMTLVITCNLGDEADKKVCAQVLKSMDFGSLR